MKLQRYDKADRSPPVDLWAASDLHLARVMENTTEEGSNDRVRISSWPGSPSDKRTSRSLWAGSWKTA